MSVDQTAEYSPATRNLAPPINTLASILHLAMTDFSQELRVCMPCKVVAVDSNYRVDIKPLFKAQYYAEKAPTSLPVIPSVPVLMPGGVNFQVKYPIDVGDVGLALFSDRAMDSFLAGTGEPVDPVEARLHHITDAVYLPGLAYDALATERDDDSDDLIMRNGTAEVRLERNGTFRIFNGDSKLELVDLIGQLAMHCEGLVQILQQAMVNTALGPMPLYAASQIQLSSALSTINLIKTSIQSLKGS